jgi:hypothetical protein
MATAAHPTRRLPTPAGAPAATDRRPRTGPIRRVIAGSRPSFRQVYDDRLSELPGVQRLSSTVVVRSVVGSRPLPL